MADYRTVAEVYQMQRLLMGRFGGLHGVRDKNGQPLAFRILVPTTSQLRQQYAQLLQAQFRKIGVQVEIDAEEHTNVVLVPVDAIVREGEDTAVYIAAGGKAQRRPVVLGIVDKDRAELKEGVKAGEQVIVHGRDLEAVLDQLGHDWIDLGIEQYQIAHRHGAAMRGLERDPAAERKRRPDGDAVERHRQVAARKAVTVNVARDGGCASSDRFIDLLPVDLLGTGGGADRRHGANCEYLNSTHDGVSLVGFHCPAAPPVP